MEPTAIVSMTGTALNQLRALMRTPGARSFEEAVEPVLELREAQEVLAALSTTVEELLGGSDAAARVVSSPEFHAMGFAAFAAQVMGSPPGVANELVEVASAPLGLLVGSARLPQIRGAVLQAAESLLALPFMGRRFKVDQPAAERLRDYASLTLQAAHRTEPTPGARAVTLDEMEALVGQLRSVAAAEDQLLVGGPPGRPRIAIDAIYVTPTLRSVPQETAASRQLPHTDEQFHVSIEELIVARRQTVILGDPGAGKTSLSHHIGHRLGTEERYGLVPLTIILREYGSPSVLLDESIVEFAYRQLSTKYNVDGRIEVLSALLRSGRIFVVFDGLDELIDTSARAEVRDRIENFVRSFPHARVVVTSRRVGYAEAPLDERVFRRIDIAPFSNAQVELYATQWFTMQCNRDGRAPADARSLTQSFMAESQAISDLRSNPLLLSLLCDLYKDDGYLPTNRPAVYQKCSVLLFERWDRHRSIAVPLQRPDAIRPAMIRLAYKMLLGDLASTAGVTRSDLVQAVAEHLSDYFSTRLEAEGAAEEFVDFLTGRAWVFTDVGTTPGGENIYAFTHRTFMEYFAAEEWLRVTESAEALISSIAPRVARAELDVVAQLVVQMACTMRAGYDVKVFGSLSQGGGLTTSDLNGRVGLFNLLSFCVRASRSVLLPNAVMKDLGDAVGRFVIEEARNELAFRDQYSSYPNIDPVVFEPMLMELGLVDQNICYWEEVERQLLGAVRDGSLSAMLLVARWLPDLNGDDPTLTDVGFLSIAERVFRQHSGAFLDHDDVRIGAALISRGYLDIEAATNKHGLRVLLTELPALGSGHGSFFLSPWESFTEFAEFAPDGDRSGALEGLRAIGRMLVSQRKAMVPVSILREMRISVASRRPAGRGQTAQWRGPDWHTELAVVALSLLGIELSLEFSEQSTRRRPKRVEVVLERLDALPGDRSLRDSLDSLVAAAASARYKVPGPPLSEFRDSVAWELVSWVEQWASRRASLVAPR